MTFRGMGPLSHCLSVWLVSHKARRYLVGLGVVTWNDSSKGERRREKEMEKTESVLWVSGQVEAWPPLSREDGLRVSSAPPWDGGSWIWGREREPAMAPNPILQDDAPWRVPWCFLWTDLVSRAKLSSPGEACVLSTLGEVWAHGKAGEWGLPTPERSASGGCELPTSGSIWGNLLSADTSIEGLQGWEAKEWRRVWRPYLPM